MEENRKKILLVEDETELRELYAMLLQDAGYEVTEAGDGEKAFEFISNGGFDLVLLDIMLPFMDGLDVLKKIKEGDYPNAQHNSSIVLLTNLAQDQIVAQALEMGIRGYMIKSDYNPEQLLETIADFL
ncbi:MAG: response regulator transcription factor [Pseudomonadales bacterium]|jgi:two-component system response regulator ResD|nr:response regulator transcription factor [Pseudomonadales bacterium]